MPFISDQKQRRTWDPESGWELLVSRGGMGALDFTLRHPNNEAIHFYGVIVSCKNTGNLLPNGRPEAETVFRLDAVDDRIAGLASDEQRHRIADALTAYGIAHNGPHGPFKLVWEEVQPVKSQLMFGIVSKEQEVVRRVAGQVLRQESKWEAVASELLDRLSIAVPTDESLSVMLERDRIAPEDVERLIEELRPFWLAMFSAMTPNAYKPLVAQNDDLVSSRSRSAAIVRALKADNVLLVLKDERLEASMSWHINPGTSGNLIIDRYSY